MIVACAFDHAGVSLRERILGVVADSGHEVLDLGTDNTVPIDYPDKALEVGQAVVAGGGGTGGGGRGSRRRGGGGGRAKLRGSAGPAAPPPPPPPQRGEREGGGAG